jgi:uncharacterized protein YutE (UPF0331/DUF86 family)
MQLSEHVSGELFRSLGVNGANELLHAYAAIDDAAVRRSVLQLAQSLAKACEGARSLGP